MGMGGDVAGMGGDVTGMGGDVYMHTACADAYAFACVGVAKVGEDRDNVVDAQWQWRCTIPIIVEVAAHPSRTMFFPCHLSTHAFIPLKRHP